MRDRSKTMALLRTPVQASHRVLTRALQRITPDEHPRTWSNREIRRVGERITGDVVHVSAWRDEDKEGGTYRHYFPNASRYVTTNVGGARGEGIDNLHLDLSAPIEDDLRQAFDLVFNHTTLEHVFDVQIALDNLFDMSRDEVLLVVPFMQVEHWEAPAYGDYWRLSEHALRQSCANHEFEVLTLTSNHNPVWPIYYCLHARRIAISAQQHHRWSIADAPPGFGSRPVAPGHRLMS